MAAVIQRIQVRRDSAANWATVNPILAAGELGCETDTLKLKVGNGLANWSALAYVGADGGTLVDNGNGTFTWTPAVGAAVTFGGVSSDAGNLLTLGADKRPMLAPAALVQPSAVAPSPNAQTAVIGISTAYARADHVHKETLTSLAYNATTKIFTYTDEAGNSSTFDLSALANDIYVTGASINATTGILTLTDNDAGTPDVVVDLHALTGTLTNNNDGTYTYTTPSGSVTFDTKRANVSTNAGNVLTLGTDSLPYYAGLTLSSVAPSALGTAAAGSATSVSRSDHVHAMPQFKELASLPALPATTQLVGLTAAGAVTYIDVLDGGAA